MKLSAMFCLIAMLTVGVTKAADMRETPGGTFQTERTPLEERYRDAPFGYYGHDHDRLHESGAIQRLMKATGTKCCDGGVGGECRSTHVVFKDNGFVALIDGKECPVPPTVRVRMDVVLPPGVSGIVCAPKWYEIDMDETGRRRYCPVIYCAAAYFSG